MADMTDEELLAFDPQRALAQFLLEFAGGMAGAGQPRPLVSAGMVAAGALQHMADHDPAATAAWLRALADRVAAIDPALPPVDLIARLLAAAETEAPPDGPGADVVQLRDRKKP